MTTNCTICKTKIMALISCVVTAWLICAFGFVCADCWSSDVAAHMSFVQITSSTDK